MTEHVMDWFRVVYVPYRSEPREVRIKAYSNEDARRKVMRVPKGQPKPVVLSVTLEPSDPA